MSRRRAAWMAGTAVAIAIWLLALGPRQLGGPVTYVITSGNSMEPSLHGGDLVLARHQETYAVGDVVAYHSPDMDKTVLHRIIDREDGRFVLEGDNNTWVDSHHPTAGEIHGKLWIRLPGAGKVIGWARSPLVLVSIMLLVGAAFAGPMAGASRRRRSSRASGTPSATPRPASLHLPKVAALAGGACLVAGAATFLVPNGVTTVREMPYFHEGHFSYSATAPSGPVYGDGRAETGDPLYLALVERAQVAFEYELAAEEEAEVGGTVRFDLAVTNEFGWSHVVPLQTGAGFEGETARVEGTVDLAALAALTDTVEEQTGTTPGKYRLELRPVVEVAGAVAGQEVSETFAPSLALHMDDSMVRLDEALAEEENSLDPSTDGTVTAPVEVANTLPVPLVDVPVAVARAALLALGLGLVGLGLVGLGLFVRPRTGSENATADGERIRARYARHLLPVTGAVVESGQSIQLGSFEALFEVAMHYEAPILHEQGDGVETFAVREGEVWYCFQVGTEPVPVPVPVSQPVEPVEPLELSEPEVGLPPEEEAKVLDAAHMGQSRFDAFLAKARVEGAIDQMRRERERRGAP